ncbi:MAG: efflux RND transporter permease subunit, partial [Cytophagales bacterium]|nr:efflux RND transporter permease subunit [Cytophagales bacterium]
MENLDKEFKVSSWSIDNKTSIYILTIFICVAGILSYMRLPKERFPDIVIPTIYVSTIYPGTSPTDMENLVTKQLEKQIKAIAGVKKVTSTSIQNFSNVVVEFNTGIKVADAKQKVKDAVDKARTDLPNDLPNTPNVVEVDFSEQPMMFVNISGDFDLAKLKEYAEDVQDKVESMKQITRVDIVGALDREIQVNVDRYKMEAANVTLRDIQNAVSYENVTVSAGELDMGDVKRAINIKGSFIDPHELDNIVIRSMSGAKVYLKDIAEIRDGFKQKESYARLAHKNVITLNVIKRSGENLIESSDKIREIIKDLQKTKFPKDLKITITGDQASSTRVTLHDLINTIIIGFILVTVILMFFMGVTNAIFVAASVPLSMFVAFLVMPTLGFSLNMIVLFAFLLALGIVVDDAIVVIENTHRIFDNGKVPIKKAAKAAAGEVFLPVFSGTMTTLAPFIPLAFWGGIIGKFMFFLPVTLIVTLLASLLVAYIINPVFAVDFMKPHVAHEHKKKFDRTFWIVTVVFGVLILLFYVSGYFGMGNFSVLLYVLYLSNKLFIESAIRNFQEKIWPKAQNGYEKILAWAVYKNRPWMLLGLTVLMLFGSIFLVAVRAPKVVFFPQSEPNFVYVYITLPIGTHQSYTDS